MAWLGEARHGGFEEAGMLFMCERCDAVTSYDAELLRTLIAEDRMTVKALAMKSGRDDKTVYAYIAGIRTVPSIVLRAAFELTRDPRIVALILPGLHILTPDEMAATCGKEPSQPGRPERIPPIDQILGKTLTAAEKTIQSGRYIEKILRDGKIDRNDLAAFGKFREHAGDALRLLSQSMASAGAEVERIRGVKHGS